MDIMEALDIFITNSVVLSRGGVFWDVAGMKAIIGVKWCDQGGFGLLIIHPELH